MANRRLFLVFVISRTGALAVLLLIAGVIAGSAYAQTNSTWNGGTGNWSNSTDWTPNAVPDNDTGNTTYDVTIGAPNSVVTMDIGSTINKLALGTKNSLNISASEGLRLSDGDSSNSGKLTNFGELVLGFVSTSSTLTNNSGAHLTNYGVLGWGTGSVLINNSGAYLLNLGTISYGSFASSPFGRLVNNGTFINNSLLSAGSYADVVNNTGAYFANSGTMNVFTSDFSNSGRFNNSGGFTFFASSDPASFSNSGTFNNSGTVTVGYSPFIQNSFSNTGTINNTGTMSVGYVNFDIGFNSYSNGGTINNSGTLTISSGTVSGLTPNLAFENSGAINNSGTFNYAGVGSILDNTGAITNTGTVNNLTGASLSNSGTLNNTGTIFNDSTSTLTNSGTLKNYGTIINSGTFTNSGAMTISKSGFFSTSTNYTQTNGSTVVNGTLTATGDAIVDIQSGFLSGTGVLNGNVLMGGTMMPGDAPGTLTIFGNYEQTSTGTFDELIGPLSSSLLNINGNVALDPGSSLEITLLNGFDPLGQTFGIMDYQSLSGEFVNGSVFWDDGFLWDVSYGQNQIDVTAVKAPEPGTSSLIGVGLIGLLICAWRKRASLCTGARFLESGEHSSHSG